MFPSPERLIEAATLTVQRLRTRSDLPDDVKVELEVVATSLLHAQKLGAGNVPAIRENARQAAGFIETLIAEIGQHGQLATLGDEANKLLIQARTLANDDEGADIPSLITLLQAFDALLAKFMNSAPQAAQSFLALDIIPMLGWLTRLNELGVVDPRPGNAAQPRNAVRVEDLQTLLRQRMEDPSIEVHDWNVLQGGYGKETSLFRVEGAKVKGEFVMRRDVGAIFMNGIDFHEVRSEFKLLKAVHERGFPVAEPMLLETRSTVVPGPDFIVVRRVPGKIEGDITGSGGKVAASVQATLARVTARIHNLDPIEGLGDEIREMHPSLWGMTTGECIRRYIRASYDLYVGRRHVPVPAVHSMFSWLFDNIPESDERVTLVHGDIGLHNLLYHQGKLSAVLDWEFSHIGDPAEDIGYISIVMGQQLDWESFLDEYCKAGRPRPDRKRIRFFEIWALIRNFSNSNISVDLFARSELENARFAMIPAHYNPYYANRIFQLIRDWDK